MRRVWLLLLAACGPAATSHDVLQHIARDDVDGAMTMAQRCSVETGGVDRGRCLLHLGVLQTQKEEWELAVQSFREAERTTPITGANDRFLFAHALIRTEEWTSARAMLAALLAAGATCRSQTWSTPKACLTPTTPLDDALAHDGLRAIAEHDHDATAARDHLVATRHVCTYPKPLAEQRKELESRPRVLRRYVPDDSWKSLEQACRFEHE